MKANPLQFKRLLYRSDVMLRQTAYFQLLIIKSAWIDYSIRQCRILTEISNSGGHYHPNILITFIINMNYALRI